MKNEAAAEVPAETPAGATKLWEATEPPVPVGSELFCPELTWTLGPSRPPSGAVSAWKKQKEKTHRLIILHDTEQLHAVLPKSVFTRVNVKTNSGWGETQVDRRTTEGPATEKVKTMTVTDKQNNTETYCDG